MTTHINTAFLSDLLTSRGGFLLTASFFVFLFPVSGNILARIFNILACRIIYQRVSFFYAVLSSVLLNAIIIIPTGLLLWSYHNLCPWEVMYDLTILIFCLEYAGFRSYARRVNAALKQNNLSLARQILHPYVLREVSSLSAMGIAKAATESIPLNFISGWFIPAFWYMTAGPEAAFSATFITILNKAFNPKQPLFCDFGRLNSLLYRAFSLFPVCLLFFILQFGTRAGIATGCAFSSMRSHPYCLTGMIIGYMAGALNVTLGGPRIYEGTKIRYNRIGLKTEPAPVHIILAFKRMRNAVFITLLFIIIGQIAWLL